MAQSEDTELRDLVIEALEKNGSLAKIRALLRANVFLAFEDDCENIKQNANLDDILNIPEGLLSLSIIHEFLEFCNLKNTLFVYVSESRQGKQYFYEGQKVLSDKFRSYTRESEKEPILVTLIKNILKSQKAYVDRSENAQEECYKDQNQTYIMHESSVSRTSSQTDTSSDEKNKLRLRLQQDNSDTDTSSDSLRDKCSSEYIPSEHILHSTIYTHDVVPNNSKEELKTQVDKTLENQTYNLKISNTSSDSTSYVELKPPDGTIEKLFPAQVQNSQLSNDPTVLQTASNKLVNEEVDKSNTSSAVSTSSMIFEKNIVEKQLNSEKSQSEELHKSEDYSPDFSLSKDKDKSSKSLYSLKENKSTLLESPHQGSQSSQSSISISDVADLIYSERSPPYGTRDNNASQSKKSESRKDTFKSSFDDSGEFTDSPIPSLSNLSLEIHSD